MGDPPAEFNTPYQDVTGTVEFTSEYKFSQSLCHFLAFKQNRYFFKSMFVGIHFQSDVHTIVPIKKTEVTGYVNTANKLLNVKHKTSEKATYKSLLQ